MSSGNESRGSRGGTEGPARARTLANGRRGMKGQFFIIGALFICSLIFFGIAPAIDITGTSTADARRLAENLATEFPRALNLGINGSGVVATLVNFTEFVADMAGQRMMNLTCRWLIFSPAAGVINVTGGNFMGSDLDFGINLSGTYKVLQVGDMSVNSTTFPVAGYNFTVSITAAGETKGALMLTNKTGLYAWLSLERGESVSRLELLA